METRRTPLYDFHLANGARMVPFAGWDMPVQYADGIKAEHLATRDSAGLFDVSHMAQIWIGGADADAALERLTPTDIGAIAEGRVRYSLFLDTNGGVLDDLMIARLDGGLQLVVNAGRADHDIAHLRANLHGANLNGANLQDANLHADVTMQVRDDRALLALQGPQSPQILHRLGVDLDNFFFMQIGHFRIDGIDCIVTRSGYTGEDGFEISMPAENAAQLAERLCADEAVSLAGLGARDTLRLEAGLPLWGHELDEAINPVAAGLRFALSRRRREAGDFPGAAAIMTDWHDGPRRRLVGLLPQGGRPVRDGAELALNGAIIGIVTSGGFAPSLDAPAALGFVDTALATPGTEINALVRGREVPVTVAALPLVPHRYIRG
ncbi:MAG: glycine cleavage system aminomethyltransferase GcvT [Alphaproteobacteria bacterium]|nr:glycine cleavage system aminomethyltransferase GcvT [Alphaproteobacteria bacterium]